jgi:hypothetical protein
LKEKISIVTERSIVHMITEKAAQLTAAGGAADHMIQHWVIMEAQHAAWHAFQYGPQQALT